MAPPSSSPTKQTTVMADNALLVRVADAAGPSSTYDGLRVFAHPTTLRAMQIQAAMPAAVLVSSKGDVNLERCFLADVWPRSSLDVQEICIPATLLLSVGLSGSCQARLLKLPNEDALSVAKEVTLTVANATTDINEETISILTSMAKEYLLCARYITPKTTFSIALPKQDVQLMITSLTRQENTSKTSSAGNHAAVHEIVAVSVKAARNMRVIIERPASKRKSAPAPAINGALQKESAYATLGGLDAQIEELRKLVELPLRRPDIFQRYGLRAPRGLLLFGPPGTGKTTLAYSAARSCVPVTSIETISGPELSSSLHGGTERALRKVFERARKNAPSVVIIDEIDALAPRRDGDADGAGEVEKRVVATLLTLMDGLGQDDTSDEARVIVIAATNRPNALDPALRRPGRLDREIEVGIPSSDGRLAILKVLLRGVPHSLTLSQVEDVANRTHGYVGADLSALVREAGMRALARDMESTSIGTTDVLTKQMSEMSLAGSGLSADDFAVAQAKVRPSAMREISLEMPKVTWDDIAPGEAGLEVQRRIRECVEWPLKHRSTMQRLGIDAPRGVLLYGPPGCSKTLIARALASESGLNFVAVKGPELLNKYVGESERALREVFRKARAASPSIVFFDEIDGLMTSRGGGTDGSGGDRLITTLLNEMDGVEQLTNVLVVAATNRPDVLDDALLRPGRLDRLLYVGPPDMQARRQILAIRTRGMALADDVQLDEIAQLTDGCSGAEVVLVCQDAGLRAMNEDINTSAVRHGHFEDAARQVRRRITPAMLRKFQLWRDQLAF